jgi:hypothetical protein
MDILRIAARVAAKSFSRRASGLPGDALDAWHNQVLKPLDEVRKVGRNMLYLTDQKMTPEEAQKAAAAVHGFCSKWEPQLSAMKTEMGAVAKAVGDSVVKSRGR